MLILSRRPSETLRFPQLGISVTVISVKGSRVQVGIDAPPEIRVIRNELQDSLEAGDRLRVNSNASGTSPNVTSPEETQTRQSNHHFRNQLNKATLGLHLAQKQLAAGLFESADRTLTQAIARLAELESTAKLAPTSANESDSTAGPTDTQRRTENAQLATTAREPKDIHVLLVEDDLNEQVLLKSLLEMEGYHVHTASNGLEAMMCLNRVSPKFVLLDMMMPQCDGRETVDRIREIPAFEHLPIFAVSGSSPASVGLKIGNDGVEDWFPKPLNAPRLLQHMRDKVACLSS